MKHKFFGKFASAAVALCIIAAPVLSVSAAEIKEDEFDSVTKQAADYNPSSLPSTYSAQKAVPVAAGSLPISYSSKTLGLVTAIKEQKYNDCWAYSGTETLETKLLKIGQSVNELSADHANAWATAQSNGKGWQRQYNGGGFQSIYPGYLTSWSGGAETSAVGTIDFSKSFYSDSIATDKTKYGTTKLRYFTDYNIDEIKQAIMDNGAVSTSYATTNYCFNAQRTAYYMPQSYDGSYVGHAICIVGWNDSISKTRFTNSTGEQPKNNGAWLVRNSWGDYNNLGGYFWISYEDKYIFGQKYAPSYTIDEVVKITDDMQLVQNEKFGATYEFDYLDDNVITFINCFNFDKNHRTLDKVMFETTAKGARYQVYYIPIKNEAPTGKESEWTLIANGTVTDAGYMYADANGFVVPEGKGAIGIKLSTNASTECTLGVGEWLTSDSKMVFLNDSKSGDSYIYAGNKMNELLNWYKTSRNDSTGGTFVIKALAATNPNLMPGDVNLDKKLTIADVTFIMKHITNLSPLSGTKLANADYNGDGEITITDATLVQRKVVGLI